MAAQQDALSQVIHWQALVHEKKWHISHFGEKAKYLQAFAAPSPLAAGPSAYSSRWLAPVLLVKCQNLCNRTRLQSAGEIISVFEPRPLS
jgi:hypothetical protein